ncbi:MAG: SlyX family protein [Rhodanobacteraceae bacterium]|nr:SlyX family protein [Rhodanobacteraceae bacterium]
MDERIQELEIRVAFQDDLLTSLNQQVHAAHQVIAQLRADLLALRERVEGMKEGASGDPAQEPPPPHY